MVPKDPYIEILNSWSVTALSEPFKQMKCLCTDQMENQNHQDGACSDTWPWGQLTITAAPHTQNSTGQTRGKVHPVTFINTNHYLNLGKVA